MYREVFAVANIVGGTIVIPHTRQAAEYWEELEENFQLNNVQYSMFKFVKLVLAACCFVSDS
jgi:hypothetical protein